MTHAAWGAILIAASALIAHPGATLAKTVYIAAQGHDTVPVPDGSRDAPYPTIDMAFERGLAGGDTAILMNGRHGPLVLRGKALTSPLEIRAQTPQKAHVSRIEVKQSRNLLFRDLSVWPLPGDERTRSLVETGANSAHISFERLDIRGAADGDRYRGWSLEKWKRDAPNGARLNGPDNAIRNSVIRATAMAITTTGSNAIVDRNKILGFRGDAMRGLGSGSRFTNNQAQDCIKVDQNHDDGFQSWSLKDKNNRLIPVRGLTIENNVILEWAGRDTHPLRCTLQGIAVFDGIQKNLRIRNNLVVISAYHGISVYGGEGIEITDNTVINALGQSEGRPWIGLFEQKNVKTPPRDATVRNNVAARYVNRTPNQRLLRASDNLTFTSPLRFFMAPLDGDFRHAHPETGRPAGFRKTPSMPALPVQTE